MSPSGIQVNKPIIILAIGLIVGVIVVYNFYYHPSEKQIPTDKLKKESQENSPMEQKSNSVTAERVTVKLMSEGKEYMVVTRQSLPLNGKSKVDILLLHGAAFSSKNWGEIKTLQLLGEWGFRAVAVDLPKGRGETTGDEPSSKVKFLNDLIKDLSLDAPVIISPSKSGEYSLPYLFQDPKSVLKYCQGFVPVAPGSSDKYTADQYKQLTLPTLIVVGEKDKSIGPVAVKNLKNIPNSEVFTVPNAGHPAYIDNPDVFHDKLKEFLDRLS